MRATADQKPAISFWETIWGFANCFHSDAKGNQRVGKLTDDVWLLGPSFRVDPSRNPCPLCLLGDASSILTPGSVSITPQQFHFPSEVKQFQSLAMLLITPVVYECCVITGVYVKNFCCFPVFLSSSQNNIHKSTPPPLPLSSPAFFWTLPEPHCAKTPKCRISALHSGCDWKKVWSKYFGPV